MTEPAAASIKSSASTRRSPWDQQKDENDLWYGRFLRFLALGPTRSVSLVVKGRRNAYPIPAHWPMQAKQQNWRERAAAFDEAIKANPALMEVFNGKLALAAASAVNGEAEPLRAAVQAGGYQMPPPDEDEDTSTASSAH